MKKRLALTAMAAIAVGLLATPSWAFQSVRITSVTAGAFVGGARVADFTLAIRDTANPFGASLSSITWSNVGSSWKIADRLLVINSTVTDSNGGIKIYTHNTAASANPRFVDPTLNVFIPPANGHNADSNAAGLLNASAATTSVPPLPMAWSIKADTKTVEGTNAFTGIGAQNPNLASGTGYNNPYQWLFMVDEYTRANGIDFNGNGILENSTTGGYREPQPLAIDANFLKMVNATGIHSGQGDGQFDARGDGLNSFVYLEADFAGASAQTPYSTNSLIVEAFIQ